MHVISKNTYFFTTIFSIIYFLYLLKKTSENKFDFYDLIMLSMVGVIPSFFIFFQHTSILFADLLGVAFPFVVMFGLLFIALFLIIIRVMSVIHQLKLDNILLIQEVGLINSELKRCIRVSDND